MCGKASAFASLRSTLRSQGKSCRMLSFMCIKAVDDDAVSHTVNYFDFEPRPGFITSLVFQTFCAVTSNAIDRFTVLLFCFILLS